MITEGKAMAGMTKGKEEIMKEKTIIGAMTIAEEIIIEETIIIMTSEKIIQLLKEDQGSLKWMQGQPSEAGKMMTTKRISKSWLVKLKETLTIAVVRNQMKEESHKARKRKFMLKTRVWGGVGNPVLKDLENELVQVRIVAISLYVYRGERLIQVATW